MTFIYPRVISVFRASHQKDGVGKMGYGGVNTTPSADEMDLVIEDVPCNIQSRSSGMINPAAIPGDTRLIQWYINIPRGKVAEGLIQRNDIVKDDYGRRFKVQGPYFHSLGWRLTVDTLEL